MQSWLAKHVEKREKWRKKVEAYTYTYTIMQFVKLLLYSLEF